ncbi:MAG: nucleotidyltransferase family protein [Desulfobacterales bacterium]|nr:nucleotidyltransferase family protein [Desulfobacterales bacterium]
MHQRDEIIRKLQRRTDEMRTRFSVRRIGLFGSHLQGAASETSDIDLLVDLSEPTFDHFMDLKFYLEDLFKQSVDLVLYDSIKPRLKPVIRKNAGRNKVSETTQGAMNISPATLKAIMEEEGVYETR